MREAPPLAFRLRPATTADAEGVVRPLAFLLPLPALGFVGGVVGVGLTICVWLPPSPNSSFVTRACWPTRTRFETTK